MLAMITDRLDDYNAKNFLNELFNASKLLGVLEAKIAGYQFGSILIPMFRNKEVMSSMLIEGTQTTITDVFEDKIRTSKKTPDKAIIEYRNHTNALLYGTEYLRGNEFTDELLKEIHRIMMTGVISSKKIDNIGKYKTRDNYIVNSAGSIVFTPPSFMETPKYMRELLYFMNNDKDGINPLIKAAIIHSQFESIHPFEDGNGRVGRLLVSLYLYKAQVINFPFFYLSEAISQDKAVYYKKLTDSREKNYDDWIKFFLQKCIVQAKNLIEYIDSLNKLYEKTKITIRETVNSPKFDQIIECIFTQPILTVGYLADKLAVTPSQAKRYIDKMENRQILLGDDRKRGRKYVFVELLDLARQR
ncbi:MAG: Fic family protein [Eubacterium sp.]|nr:Fic family protein [Eubacterium sp.]